MARLCYVSLNVCAVRNHFRSCINSDLLRKHNLISPDDFTDVHVPPVPPPSGMIHLSLLFKLASHIQ